MNYLRQQLKSQHHEDEPVSNHSFPKFYVSMSSPFLSLSPSLFLSLRLFVFFQVRLVSNRILSTANEDVVSDNLYTHLITIFGQWTDHDLTFTPHSPSISSFNSGINCHGSCEHTEPCFPIRVCYHSEYPYSFPSVHLHIS